MSNNGEFSLEQSEELIAHLKAGGHSDFEQLRSTLNLLGHVTELPPTSIPPVLPSSISQPVPVLPLKSSKPRRTIATSIIVTGFFASASLAAAAVTGIGPAAVVNVGHQAAKFVKGVVGGVAHVVTGNPSDTAQNQAASPATPLPIPSLSPAPPNADENNQSDSQHLTPIIPALTNLFPLVSPETNSHENDSQKPNSSHEVQGPVAENSPAAIPSGEKDQTKGEDQNQPSAHPSVKPTQEATDQESSPPTPTPTSEPSSTPEPTPTPEQSSEQTIPSPSPSDQSSEND